MACLGYPFGGKQIGFELRREHICQFRTISRDANFEIQPETAGIEVGCPDQAVVVVHDKGLGMQHAIVIFPDFHTGTHHFVEIGTGGSRDPRCESLIFGTSSRTSIPRNAADVRAKRVASVGTK